eukprot:18369-Chlamydomonas_euryale.AAC.1
MGLTASGPYHCQTSAGSERTDGFRPNWRLQRRSGVWSSGVGEDKSGGAGVGSGSLPRAGRCGQSRGQDRRDMTQEECRVGAWGGRVAGRGATEGGAAGKRVRSRTCAASSAACAASASAALAPAARPAALATKC